MQPAARSFTVSQRCAGHPLRVHVIDIPTISRMSKSNKTQFEVLPTTTGDSWRVRIIEQERTQYINGFESRTQAEHWVVNKAEIWLSELRRLAITPLTGSQV